MSIVSNPNKPGRRKGANKTRVWFYSSECRYDVVLDKAKKFGWKLVSDEKNEHNCNFYWIDSATIHERFRTISPWQVINHFPGMPNIARKNRMGQNLNRMQKIMPAEYNFYPRTWVLPGEFTDFEKNFDSQGNSSKIFIIKPDSGCQGRGIFLTKRLDNIPRNENVVAQVYIKRPMVIDDFKFDLRIYVYVSSVRPLRMYLFHDGLVRMCTEKYVKPTKQNLENTCMHLTNYAVNKNSGAFNQPTAASSEDDMSGQEDAHKRSLLWFMNHVRQKYGEAKADWLWRRIGILCVRTLMSIMPTLSRDYQQHFKSFGNIPTDIDSIRKGEAATSSTSTKTGGSTKDGKSASNQDTEDEEDGDRNENESDAEGSVANDKGEGGVKDPDVKMRGSRAFEVLGFDIMLDDKLKPWLIEVNHLPSFATESPLDLDIKSRLMEQVFNTLPVRMDDEQAYQAYHQFESEKRLRKGRSDPSMDSKDDKKSTSRSKSLDRNSEPRERKPDPTPVDPVAAAEAEEARLEKEKNERELYEVKEREYLLSAQNKALEALATAAATAAQALCRGAEMPHFAFTTTLDGSGEVVVTTLISENDTQYRLLEINEILAGVYEQYCPEKISKIDRLLCKYQGREEEFLQFVVQKYSVGEQLLTNIIECVLPKYHPITIPAFTMKKAPEDTESTEDGEKTAPRKPNMVPRPPVDKNKTGAPGSTLNNNAKRNSRSLSPPGAGSSSRAQASWKGGTAEEEEAFKEEVLSTHVPKDDDEWMVFEGKFLHQFTRIFPVVEPTKTGGAALSEQEAAELEAKEEEEEEAEDKIDEDKASKTSGAKDGKDGKEAAKDIKAEQKIKIASYTEIMHQVFVADRRQTMRFHVPLGGARRATAAEDSKDGTLPPLHEPFRAGNANTSSMNKPGPGWRAPVYKPPQQEKKNLVPTQSQVDVAKRLTQGMSSAPLPYGSKSQKQSNAANQGHYAFQLDKSDDDQSMGGPQGVIAATGLSTLGNSNSVGQDMSMHPRISK
jgi:tubulin polyglutamylase TTLL6/13